MGAGVKQKKGNMEKVGGGERVEKEKVKVPRGKQKQLWVWLTKYFSGFLNYLGKPLLSCYYPQISFKRHCLFILRFL